MSKGFSLIVFLSVFLLNMASSFASDYILCLRARGHLGEELCTYWHAVKKNHDINHDAIKHFPPHCSLTGFFPKVDSKETYIQAVEQALQQHERAIKSITINGLVQGSEKAKLDYIKLTSAYLFAVTRTFINIAAIPQRHLKDPHDFPYHITLRDHVFHHDVEKKLKKIQSLERKINLSAQVSWSLFLYERHDDHDERHDDHDERHDDHDERHDDHHERHDDHKLRVIHEFPLHFVVIL